MESKRFQPYNVRISSPVGTLVTGGILKEHSGLPVAQKKRRYPFFALVAVQNGTGMHIDEREHRHPISDGSLILVHKQIPHWYGPTPGTLWDETFISIDGPMFAAWFQLLVTAPRVLNSVPTAADTMRQWLDQSQACQSPADQAAHLLQLLNHIHSWTHESIQASSGPDAWLIRAQNALSHNLVGPYDPQSPADELDCSPETFRKRFTRLSGVSPRDYREEKRVEALLLQLAHSPKLTNDALAHAYGFSDGFHLAKHVKARRGKTLGEFRRLSGA